MDETPVSAVTLQILNGLIEAQAQLRDAAEKRWAFAREALFNLARLVAADWLEEKQQKKGGLEVVRIEELSRVVFERVTALRTAYAHPDAEQLRNVLTRNDALRQEVEKLTALSRGCQGELERANQEIARLNTPPEVKKSKSASPVSTAVVRQVTPAAVREEFPPEPVEPEPQAAGPTPAWFEKWAASEGFEKQSFIIHLMGETGISVRPDILKALTTRYEAARTSGACIRAFNYLAENLFIITGETAGGLPGHPPQTVRLGPLGETAYQLLTGKRPVKASFDEIRSAHSTDAHTLLILKVGAILEVEGYEILSMGEMEFTLPDGRVTSPDILVRAPKSGRELHVEVERNTGKGDPEARERKWQNVFDASQGFLYVFCETEKSQKAILQEINHALASESRLARASIFMSNLEAVAANERHPDGSLWVSQKRP